MPAPKSTATSLFTGILGTLGFSVAAGVLVTVMVAPAIAVTGITATNTVGIFNDLPEYIELDPGSQQNTIVAINPDGTELPLATIYKQNREEVTLDQISDYLECAAIAGEDRRFYEHGGVDVPSVVRAAVGQVTGDDAGGASTLTMQTVRNIWQQQALNDPDLTPEQRQEEIAKALEQTIDRKIREMKYAIGLEKNYSKEEILQGYLNIAGFGGNTYGVQAAAKQYFGLDASELSIAQAASLIAIVQYPNARNLGDPDNFADNQERRDIILYAMRHFGTTGEEGCISESEYQEALDIPVDENFVNPQDATVGCRNAEPRYGFVCDYVLRIVDELDALGSTPEERRQAWDRGGYKVVVTIQTDMQTAAWDTVHRLAPSNETRFQLGSASASVEVGTGNIIQMVQNKNFDDALEPEDPQNSTAVNYATDLAHGGSTGFQPGSTWKPFVLQAFLAAGHGIEEAFNASILEFNQAEFADSCPPVGENGPPYGGIFKTKNDANEQGSWTVRRATAQSVNSVFVQMAKAIDQCEIVKLADSIGVHNANGNPLESNPACSIGGCRNNVDPITLAAAYAAISNQGVYCAPRMVADVIRVETGESLGGQPVECGQSLVSPGVANTTAYAMQGVMSGTGRSSNPNDGTPYIGKTGTTDRSVHTWMAGSSTRVATAVWVGNIVGEQALRSIRVNGLTAALIRHEIFRPVAQAIDTRYPGGAFPAPDPALLVGSPVEVPNVVGLSPEAAKQAIEEVSELIYADGGEVDSDLPAGQVASTNPGAGAQVPRGTTVTVYRSNGLAEPVPGGAVGTPHAAAEADYESQGWDTDTVCVDDEDLGIPPATPPGPVGMVYAQDPAPGTMRNPASTTITLQYYQPVC